MARNVLKHPYVEDKVFLVTGGAAGIGAGVVRDLVAENARYVAFLDIAEREGAALETELHVKFGALRAKFIKCDVADEQQLADAYKQVLEKYYRLDGVINSAAIVSADERSYKNIVDVNFAAVVNSTTNALDVMSIEKGGNGGVIVNMCSLLALRPDTRLPVYAATKAAVLQFSNAIGSKKFYAKTQVRVVTVCLGPTDTAILHRHLDNFDKDCEQCLTTRASVRQRVESAVTGVVDVMNIGETGSTWVVANDSPPLDISKDVAEGFQILSRNVKEV